MSLGPCDELYHTACRLRYAKAVRVTSVTVQHAVLCINTAEKHPFERLRKKGAISLFSLFSLVLSLFSLASLYTLYILSLFLETCW